ncbi:hybrid sensor histidine kinase/response regulator [Halobellus rubicundus]|uniref:histidine kinase n=1 Tax=Halobellus rubicundus TaxID=2996466 RepID=A0ABD5MC25_9EURY
MTESGDPERPISDRHSEIRVLHVDDDPDFVDLTASFLTRINDSFSVYTSTNPETVLERVRGERLDCVVSDYEMPQMNGLELLERVRDLDEDVPFILFTGKGSEEIASKAISAGVTDYLQKEVGTEQYTVLANRIENAVEQNRSLEALAESQRRLSRFIDQSPLGTIEYDENFRIVRVNEAAGEITGYEPEELVGGTWLPIVPEEERRHVAEVERQLLSDRGGYQSVNEIVRKDGERRLCSWHNRVVTDEDGDVITIFSQFEDITEKRRQRRELERTNAIRSTLFETLPVGVLAEDADRNVLQVNDRLFELFEFSQSPEDVVGDDCERFAKRISGRFAEPERFVDRINEIIAEREPVWNEEVVFADGRALERSYRPIELPEGRGHLWVYHDVSERRKRERRLEALNETARELMRAETNERVAQIGVDAARSILDLDLNAIHLYDPDKGLDPVAATEGTYDVIGEPPTFSLDDSIAGRVFQEGEPSVVTDVHEDPDRHNEDTPIRSEVFFPLGDYGILLAGSKEPDAFDESELVLGEILSVNVVRALEQVERNERLRERERELTRQNARLEQFASVVSHDLRNPLNVAEGRLELAMEECDSEQLESVRNAHERMKSLVDDLLTLARKRDTEVDREPVRLDQFVRTCWANVDTGEAALEVETDRELAADESQLRQLFENLFRNAVEHGGADVTVTVGSVEGGFYVEDDGPGIPAEDRDEIFEYGFSTARNGTGFGLAIVQQCVEAHGWEIQPAEGEAGGARFEIYTD